MRRKTTFGINPPFGGLSRAKGQVVHVLRTRLPLSYFNFTPKGFVKIISLDLHVLTTPLAFTLSQDQTLR